MTPTGVRVNVSVPLIRATRSRSVSSAETIAAPRFMPVLLAEDGATPAEAAVRMEIAVGLAVVRVGADVDGPEAGPARRRGELPGG
jgi:hypothetical protein